MSGLKHAFHAYANIANDERNTFRFLDVDYPTRQLIKIGRRPIFEDMRMRYRTMSIGRTVIYSHKYRLEYWRDGDKVWIPVHKKDYDVGPGHYELRGRLVVFSVPYKMAKGCFENL